jgi:hypothetical protein
MKLELKKRLIEERDSYKKIAKHAKIYKARLLYLENDIAQEMKTTLSSVS